MAPNGLQPFPNRNILPGLPFLRPWHRPIVLGGRRDGTVGLVDLYQSYPQRQVTTARCLGTAVGYNPNEPDKGGTSYDVSSQRDRNVAKSVLAIGNCSYDHGNLREAIRKHFDANVQAASHAEEALKLLQAGAYDLVLVNRVLEDDRSSGIELIRRIKTECATGRPGGHACQQFPGRAGPGR